MFKFLFYTNVQWIWSKQFKKILFPIARTATRLLMQRVSVLNCPSIQTWILMNVCIFVSVHPKGRVSRWSSSGGLESGGKRNRCNRDFRPFAKTLKLFLSLSLFLFIQGVESSKSQLTVRAAFSVDRTVISGNEQSCRRRERERDLEINIKQGTTRDTGFNDVWFGLMKSRQVAQRKRHCV